MILSLKVIFKNDVLTIREQDFMERWLYVMLETQQFQGVPSLRDYILYSKTWAILSPSTKDGVSVPLSPPPAQHKSVALLE